MFSLRKPRSIVPAYSPLPPLETFTHIGQKAHDLNSWAIGSLYGDGTIGRNRDFAPGDDGAALAAVVIEDVYACLQARLQAIDMMKWKICKLQGNVPRDDDPVIATREDVLPAHPLAVALRWFRVRYKFSFFHIWHYSKLVTGKAFVQPLKNITGSYSDLEWYNPTAVYIEAPQGVITKFRYFGRGETLNFEPRELVYDYYPNLVDEVEGQSPIEVTLDSLNIERNLKRALNAYFRNGMRLGAIVSPGEAAKNLFSEQQLRDIIREMKTENKGVDNTSKDLLLPWGVDVTYPPQQRYEHLDSVEERITTKIHKVLRVPAAIAGDMSETRYKEHKDMYDAWVSLVIIPETRDMRDVVNFHMMPKFDPSGTTYFKFDESEWADRVTQAELDKREAAEKDLNNSGITIRQYNERVGNKMTPETADELDVRFLPPDKLIVRAGELAQAIPNPAIPPQDNAQVVTAQIDQQAQAPQLTAGIDTAKEGTQSACLLLKLANSPDILALRQRLTEHLGDTQMEWHDPDSYHVTLAFAPAVTDEQLTTLKRLLEEISLPDLELNIGSLNAFDDMGRYAVHFRIRRNTPLLKLHQRLVDVCMDAGIGLSTYSDPANYIPHITMGYAASKISGETYHSKITVKVDKLQLTGEDHAVLWELGGDDEPDPVATQDDALEELKAWRRFASKPQKRVFEIQHLRGDVEHYIKARLAEDKPDLVDIFTRAEKRLTYTKAIQATRLDFEDTITEVIKEARAGRLTRVRFGTILRDVIKRYGRMAYIDGVVDGGVTGAELDDEDYQTITELTKDQSAFVTSFGDTLFKGEPISEDAAAQKPTMWFNKSIAPFYTAGLASADKNGYYEWAYGDTEHCDDCLMLNGQVHRMRDYVRSGWLPKADKLQCKGFQCKCTLNRKDGARAKGKFPAVKSHIHEADAMV